MNPHKGAPTFLSNNDGLGGILFSLFSRVIA